ncbi:type III restriction endonuclease subunit R [Natrialba sp. SSL1]|nr:type III restriction endonuclease subunit R [Natrialba sp. SSL1]
MGGDQLDKKIDSWKEQLIDLTRRNNMVDFRATKTKSLPTQATNWRTVVDRLADDDTLYIYRPRILSDSEETEIELVPDSSDDTELIPTREPDEAENSLYNIALNQRKHLQEKGVDSLYLVFGMFEWFSVDYSDTKLRSPLFLASVSIDRETVSDPNRHDYVITSDDEVIINPALRKKLTSEFGISLPGDEAFGLDNLTETAAEIESLIDGRDRWQTTDDVILGIFDFAKLSLYNDLEENREAIKSNSIIQALNGDQSSLNTNIGDVPTAETLDQQVDPVNTYQVLEADSSQQEAIEAAKSSVSFVLQGPPGTGKSQTIANILAEKLAAGERVLFVSEKQAALDVVKSRMDEVGLGRFCLSAHGQKATKDDILSSLETELNASPVKEPRERSKELGKLRKRRTELNEYGELIHEKIGSRSVTPYEAHGILSAVDDAPRTSWSLDDTLGVTGTEYDRVVDQLNQLEEFETEIEEYDSHPWRHTTISNWQVDTADRMRDSIEAQKRVLGDLSTFSERLGKILGHEIDSINQLEDVVTTLELLHERPPIEWQSRYFETDFYRSERQLTGLKEHCIRIHELEEDLLETYDRSYLSEDGQELSRELNEYGLLRYISPSYRRLKQRILEHADSDYSPGIDELQSDAKDLAELQTAKEERREYESLIDQLGYLYEGTDTDWEQIETVQLWVQDVESVDVIDTDRIRGLLTEDSLDVSNLLETGKELLREWENASTYFRNSMDADSITTVAGSSLYGASLEETESQLSAYEEELGRLQSWIRFKQKFEEAKKGFAKGFVTEYVTADYPPDRLVDAFKRQFYTDWINAVYTETALGDFSATEQEKRLEEFRRLDKKQQELAKVEIQHRVTSRRPTMSLEHASSSQQVLLRREIEKQRNRKPLRQLFDEAGDMITRLKPCFMMSPLAVAQYLKTTSIDFDVVIFDEASQIMPHDAVSSLIRADQAIIVGDTKQLPPTDFFNASVESDDDVREDLESILDEAAAVLPEKHLRWHYRSRTDELIEFSNQKYYAGRLRTFPENEPETPTGIEFDYCEDGLYDRGGSRQNVPEAEQVVDRIVEHASEYSDKSLGVVAFSAAQEQAIRDTIEKRREQSPTLDRFIDEDDAVEGFFVKNLEAVQGDERDVMLFSVGYGPDDAGKLTMNFGPLNNNGGERRLNVAVTRAKERVIVVSSIQPNEIDTSRTDARGVIDFKKYLKYAKKGERVLVRDDEATETLEFDSSFEEAVYTALEEEGYDVVTQVQSSGYSIDLAIKHPERPGEFILGVECDGAAYHSSRTARDRDRTRQMVLEDLGWTIHRIWSPDWASNKDGELQKIREKFDSLTAGDQPTSSVDVEVESVDAKTTENPTHDGGHPDFVPYHEPTANPRAVDSFNDLSSYRVQSKLSEVVNEYGPIEKEQAYRILLDGWGISRLGKRIHRSLESTTRGLHGQQLYAHDGFLWPENPVEPITVRVANGGDRRDIEEVPIEEIAKAAYVILNNGLEISREDLVLETARQLGYSRIGSNIESRTEQAIDLLEEVNAIDSDDRLRCVDVDIDSVLQYQIYD